jgi:hypothetical protein
VREGNFAHLLRYREGARVGALERAIPRICTFQTASDCWVPRMDRREALRFNLNVPIRFMWKNHGTSAESGSGKTRDISFKGLFVLADVCPPVGSAIRGKVMLPSPGGSDLVIRIKAVVLRVEPTDVNEYAGGFAALTKKYSLERRHQERSEKQEVLDEG